MQLVYEPNYGAIRRIYFFPRPLSDKFLKKINGGCTDVKEKQMPVLCCCFIRFADGLGLGPFLCSRTPPHESDLCLFSGFSYGSSIAVEKGYFKQLGLDLEAVNIPNPATRNSLFPKKEINGAFLPSQTALMFVEKGIDVIMVCGIGNRTFDFAVLTDSPIKSIKDFDGKTIANTFNTSNPWFALDYDMNKAHVKAKVLFTKTASDRLSMLMSGNVDVILSNPSTEARLGDGLRIVHTCSTSKYLWNSCGWWFKPDYIKENPEAVRKFVKGLAMARKLIIENPQEAIAIFSKYNKLNDGSFKKPFVLPQFDNPPVVYTYGLQKTYGIMRDYGRIKKNIDPGSLVDDRFAKSLKTPY